MSGMCTRAVRRVVLETLESRLLLSTLPNESGLTSPQFSDLWWLQNTGQALTIANEGPPSGTPGADIHAPQAWDLTTGSRNVVVAVLDTGIDQSQPDLVPNIWTNPADGTHGWNFVDNNADVQDYDGHGTQVAGIIGAVGNNGQGIVGVNWNVSIMAVKVAAGGNAPTSPANIAAGINYVVNLKQQGVNVVAINNSHMDSDMLTPDVINAIQAANQAGILFVSAAGNSGINVDQSLGPAGVAAWTALPNVMNVAATNARDQLWAQSNIGQQTVALAAPGVDILTTSNDPTNPYSAATGTSFAAPMVVGTAALLAAYNPNLTMAQIKAAILNNTDPLPGLANVVTTGGRLDAFKALSSINGTGSPVGSVDTVNANVVDGWAFDANLGTSPETVLVFVDGQQVASVLADRTRADLVPVVGSANHGFNVPLSLTPGTHAIDVYFVNAPVNTNVLAGHFSVTQPGVAGANQLVGNIDLVTATQVLGWAGDMADPATPVQARIDIDGQTGTVFTADTSRSDLAAVFNGNTAHAFTATIPTLSPGFHRVELVTLGANNTTTVVSAVTANTNRAPTGSVDVISGDTVAGWAFDADSPNTPVQVQVTVDGVPRPLVAASGHRQDLVPVVGGANHGFNLQLPALMGTHTIAVGFVDNETKAVTPVASQTVTVNPPNNDQPPVGSVDSITSSAVTGWALDPDQPTASITVRVDIDGIQLGPATASGDRQDLIPLYGSANHGFSIALPPQPRGSHLIDVYFYDNETHIQYLALTRVPRSQPITGAVDALTAQQISGWAFDPNAGPIPIQVRVDVDGVPGIPVTASGNRQDLVPVVGTADHGFAFAAPNLSPGPHTITVVAFDGLTLLTTVLAQQVVTYA